MNHALKTIWVSTLVGIQPVWPGACGTYTAPHSAGALGQSGVGGPREAKNARQVGLDHRRPLLVCHVLRCIESRDAGVIDEDLEVAQRVLSGIDGGRDIGRLVDVARHTDAASTQTFDLGAYPLTLLVVAGGDADIGAGLCKPERDAAADAPIATGNNRRLTIQVEKADDFPPQRRYPTTAQQARQGTPPRMAIADSSRLLRLKRRDRIDSCRQESLMKSAYPP